MKELKVLFRDRAGMAVLILMPSMLIFIMVVVQDVPFRDFQENKIPIAIINTDQDSLGNMIVRGMIQSEIFDVKLFSSKDDKESVISDVEKGKYKVAISIPSNTSKDLRDKVKLLISKSLYGNEAKIDDSTSSKKVELYFDPVIKHSFKQTVTNNLEKNLARIELITMVEIFGTSMKELLPDMQSFELLEEPLVGLVEMSHDRRLDPGMANFNSVQHNVPAYTIFGMFFMIITMAANIIKERDDGSEIRLKLIPGSFWPSRLGRISAYTIITFLQAILMLSIGLFLLPLFSFPTLRIGDDYVSITILLVTTGLASCGLGLLSGTIFKTHQQSAVFGAVSVVIMSALGGVWVPIWVMPAAIQNISRYNPVSWSLEACNNLFLRNGNFSSISHNIIYLLAFFLLTLLVSLLIERRQSQQN